MAQYTIQEEQDFLWNALDDLVPISVDNVRIDLNAELAELERSSIKNALDTCNQNQTRAAKMLNVGRTALIAKMKKYELID
tara:strand:- start:10411 stop:10653 length:243 start_codon:yes stop_codon:yes gene_type:complete